METDVLIIGTGFGGIGLAIRLLQAGRSRFVMLEKAADVGGVWRENRHYPVLWQLGLPHARLDREVGRGREALAGGGQDQL